MSTRPLSGSVDTFHLEIDDIDFAISEKDPSNMFEKSIIRKVWTSKGKLFTEHVVRRMEKIIRDELQFCLDKPLHCLHAFYN